MRHRAWMFALLFASCAAQVPSEPAAPAPSPRADPIERELYSAELVMDHQAALGLEAAQRDAIRAELQRAQHDLVDAEWHLREEREGLARMLAAPQVDEASAMSAAARVTSAEATIKQIHLRLLIRIKNQLTPAQQHQLDLSR